MKSSLQNEFLIFWASKIWRRQEYSKTEREGARALCSEYSLIWLKGREKLECLGKGEQALLLGAPECHIGAQRRAPFPQSWERTLESASERVSVFFWHLPLGAPQPELHC